MKEIAIRDVKAKIITELVIHLLRGLQISSEHAADIDHAVNLATDRNFYD